MTKTIKLKVEKIQDAQDKKYVIEVLDSIIESLHDFSGIISNLDFIKDKDFFYIKFNLKVCKSGDLVWILCKEFLQCIRETEPYVDICIDEVEQNGIGTTYKFYTYRSQC